MGGGHQVTAAWLAAPPTAKRALWIATLPIRRDALLGHTQPRRRGVEARRRSSRNAAILVRKTKQRHVPFTKGKGETFLFCIICAARKNEVHLKKILSFSLPFAAYPEHGPKRRGEGRGALSIKIVICSLTSQNKPKGTSLFGKN